MKREMLLAGAVVLALVGCDGAGDGERVEASPPVAENATAADAEVGQGLLDPNEATRDELLSVPGLEEQAVDALLEGRPYDDMRAVDAVLAGHMNADAREGVYARVWKPLDLNAASAEEILLIPGVGESMLHEFEEYRPYRGIAEFRREIGKYADEETVARWERYVRVER